MESSLRAYDRLADRIRLHRQVDERFVVVVEGPSDRRLVERLIPSSSATVFIGNSRDHVLEAADDLRRFDLDRVACVVDRDFDDRVAATQAAGLPVVSYDGADLEDMLAHSPAMERMIGELGSENKLNSYGGAERLLAQAREQSLPLARLRRLNVSRGWSLDFNAIDIANKVDKVTLELNVTGVCMALRQTWSEAVAQRELEECARSGDAGRCPRTGRDLVRGRDLLALVGVGLRKLIGTRSKAQTSSEMLEDVLRSSADLEWLKQSDWFGELLRLGEIVQ